MRGRNGYAELLDVHRQVARAEQPRIEPNNYGTLDGSGNLTIYGFPHAFKPGEYGYLVHDNFLLDPFTATNPTTVADHGAHTHTVIRPPELLPRPQWPAGTVVLVVWILGRSRPVIVGRIVE